MSHYDRFRSAPDVTAVREMRNFRDTLARARSGGWMGIPQKRVDAHTLRWRALTRNKPIFFLPNNLIFRKDRPLSCYISRLGLLQVSILCSCGRWQWFLHYETTPFMSPQCQFAYFISFCKDKASNYVGNLVRTLWKIPFSFHFQT